MKFLEACILSVIALAPVAALAQTADAKYCEALSDTYRKLNKANMAAGVPEAMNQCKQGNTAAGIPTLEKALKDEKVTRSQETAPVIASSGPV